MSGGRSRHPRSDTTAKAGASTVRIGATRHGTLGDGVTDHRQDLDAAGLEEKLAKFIRSYLDAVERGDEGLKEEQARWIGATLERILGSHLSEDSRWIRGAWIDGILPHSLARSPDGSTGIVLQGLAVWDGHNWEGRSGQWSEPFRANVRLSAKSDDAIDEYTLCFGSAAHGLGGVPYGRSYVKVPDWISPREWWVTFQKRSKA